MDNSYALLLLVAKQVNIKEFCDEFNIQSTYQEYTELSFPLGIYNHKFSLILLSEFEFKYLISFFDLRSCIGGAS